MVDIDHDPYLSLSSEGSALVLVTCYPFDALRPGGPLRYVVTARAVLSEVVHIGSGHKPLSENFTL